jgi:hypothetical protein
MAFYFFHSNSFPLQTGTPWRQGSSGPIPAPSHLSLARRGASDRVPTTAAASEYSTTQMSLRKGSGWLTARPEVSKGAHLCGCFDTSARTDLRTRAPRTSRVPIEIRRIKAPSRGTLSLRAIIPKNGVEFPCLIFHNAAASPVQFWSDSETDLSRRTCPKTSPEYPLPLQVSGWGIRKPGMRIFPKGLP